jgi:glycosyltransferase involved in cell wall biosynthesis
MKIAVIELECHAEVLRSTILLFSKLPDYQLTIFTTPEIVAEAGFTTESSYYLNVILKYSDETDKSFLERNVDRINNNNNYLLINTLQRKFYIYNALNITIPIAIRVHNSHFYWSEIFQNKKYRLAKYKLLLKEIYKLEILQRKQFLKKVNYFFFPSESTLNYANQKYPFLKSKAYLFPLNFQNTNSNPIKVKENQKTIVIPGKVDPLRKDLDFILSFVKLLHQKPIDFVVNLVFLGVTEGEKATHFMDKIMRCSSNHFKIVYFKNIVPLEEYSNYIQSCDVVWCPIYIHTVFQLSKEIYGKTKVSGGVNDAINFGKWCFVPTGYLVDTSLHKQVLTYETTRDLYDLLKDNLLNSSEIPLIAIDSPYHMENQHTFIQTFLK